MKRRIKHVFVFCFLSLLMPSCTFTGVRRVDVDHWIKRDFLQLGISVDLPKDIENPDFYVGNLNSSKYMSFSMHCHYYGVGEPSRIIMGKIYVLNRKEYQLYLSNKNRNIFWNAFDNTSFFKNLTEYEIDSSRYGKLLCYRKDYCNKTTGEIVLAAISYNRITENIQYKDEDIIAIKRILNSVKFLK